MDSRLIGLLLIGAMTLWVAYKIWTGGKDKRK